MTHRLRIALLALVCTLVAILSTAPASAQIAPIDTPPSALSKAADSRLGLDGQIAYCTYCFSLREPRLASGNSVVGLRRASDPSLRWKARPRQLFGGTEVYDMRARQWVPELGAFLSIDEYRFHDGETTTLWSWPRQNPIAVSDPSGHDATTNNPVQDLLDGGWLPPGLTIFGQGVRQRNAGISMLANDATFEQGMAMLDCGNAKIAASAGIISADAAVIAGAADFALSASNLLRGGGSRAVTKEAGAGPSGPADVLYHYTDHPAESFSNGLWSGSSVTDNPFLSPSQAVQQLGLKSVPDKIIPIVDNGHFVPNRPFIVEPHPLGAGGGRDFTNPRRVPGDDILLPLRIRP